MDSEEKKDKKTTHSIECSDDGIQYNYTLTLASLLLNPPEILVYRILFICLLPCSLWILFLSSGNATQLILAFALIVALFYFLKRIVFRATLPLHSRGKIMSLCITKNTVAFEVNGQFYSISKKLVRLRRGLAGVHIVSSIWCSYFLVNADIVSFDELKSKINVSD